MKTFPRWLLSFLSGVAFTCLAALLGLVGCAVSPTSTAMNDQPIDDYNAALAATAMPASGPSQAPEPGEAERRGLEAWKALLGDLSAENLSGKASQVYAEETFFNDTLKTLRSAAAVDEYLVETGNLLESGSVEFLDTVRSPDGSTYVRWEMVYRGKKLAGGEPIRTIGMTQLRFDADGRVVLHQDFWDSTRGIFGHVPVIGGMLRWVKGRL